MTIFGHHLGTVDYLLLIFIAFMIAKEIRGHYLIKELDSIMSVIDTLFAKIEGMSKDYYTISIREKHGERWLRIYQVSTNRRIKKSILAAQKYAEELAGFLKNPPRRETFDDELLLEEYYARCTVEPTDPAKKILFAIMNNLLSRSGFNNVWNEIDNETRKEIFAENLELIYRVL